MTPELRTQDLRWIVLDGADRRTLQVALGYWQQQLARQPALVATAEGQVEWARIQRLLGRLRDVQH
jgi:hypothetical protein